MKTQSSNVGVFVRIRPTANFSPDVVECLPDGQTVNIHPRKDSRKQQDTRSNQLSYWSFRLEGVLQAVSQEEVYARVCQRVVLGALDGHNGTVMCYGQTGAGKTFTMTGSTESYQQRGVIPRALQEVFLEVEKRTEHVFSVHLSYLEIYNETLVDLLQGPPRPSPRGMVVMEEPGGGVFIRGLTLHPVHNEEEALNLLFEAELNHIIGSHALNKNSSRSHRIFTVHIESRSRSLSDVKYITAKLNLVDLAGSERLEKTGSEGQMLKEAMYINKSLSFLEQAILALADRRRDFVPFRQTKLTHALKDTLGGNCNTVLVANIYGEAAHMEDTLSTLRFASRMKCVQTHAAVNEHNGTAAQIKKLKKDVHMLREELSIYTTLAKRPSSPDDLLSKAELADIQSQVQRYLEGSLEEISIASNRQIQAAFAQFKLAVQGKQKIELCRSKKVEKDQRGNKAAVKVDGRGGTDDVDVGGFETSTQSQKTSQLQSSTKTRRPKNKPSPGKRAGSPVSRSRLESVSKSKLNSVQTPEPEDESREPEPEGRDARESQPPANDPFPLETSPPKDLPSPPGSARSKAEAFEDFKVGHGSKISRILKENKAVLRERHGLLQQLTEEVNAVKREIDFALASIQQQQEEEEEEEARRGRGQHLVTEEEPDAASLLQLRELKGQYRQRYQVHCDIKAEVDYCQQLVDQCRVKLFSEFENWYEKSFPAPEEELDITMETTREQGKEQLLEEELLPDNSESFYNARYRMLKKRSIRALCFTPVPRKTSWSSPR
ncbi:kinesin-like protein KIF9 [Pseudoliparis swirei]|uniref:kinesin-like protein KIF9 n=1 Tax=Pseudoliparis swirei TaxID=2059687 RepID=UPI0024BEF1FA|nr:kinesin-like protein KIF9 [Pseudoliparis swirei]